MKHLITLARRNGIAGFTAECGARMAQHSAQNIINAIDGTLDPERVVNAEAIGLKQK